MEYFKLQIGCMLIVLYIAFIYIREMKAYGIHKRDMTFEKFWITGAISIIFDGATAYTVNHLDIVPSVINGILHMFFLCSLDAIIFMMFMYVLDITIDIPKKKGERFIYTIPFALCIAVVIIFLPELQYIHGDVTNYSMGIPVYTCYAMVVLYTIAMIVVYMISRHNLDKHKRITISTCIIGTVVVTVFQVIYPQALITCLVPTLVILGTYLNLENPVFGKLKAHNNEMVMGFATLVENRDDNTGGHIMRTTEYVKMLARGLKERGFYRNELTRDYMDNLIMAAPMHDIGKIAIPDAILQKPGKLTDEEYAIMKTHAARGGEIIRDTFGSVGEDDYEKMAYEVARHHHEKWNGKGYPDGLCHMDIPLCARIMAIADVFDAVSAKRCYRDAMPLDKCFQIIEDGIGTDFDPVIARVFLDMRDQVEKVSANYRN